MQADSFYRTLLYFEKETKYPLEHRTFFKWYTRKKSFVIVNKENYKGGNKLSNIHDNAYALEKAIRESDEFKELKESYDQVMNDPASKEMFEGFRDTQVAIQEKQMQGQEITQEEIEKAQQVVELVQQHTEISALMEKEQRLNVVINDISQIITTPLEELYGPQDQADQE